MSLLLKYLLVADSFPKWVRVQILVVSVEADSSHWAHRVVLTSPVWEVVVISLFQDVMRSSVVGLLVHHPAGNTLRSDTSAFVHVGNSNPSFQHLPSDALTLLPGLGWRRPCWGCSGSSGWECRPGSPSSSQRIQRAQTAEPWLRCCPGKHGDAVTDPVSMPRRRHRCGDRLTCLTARTDEMWSAWAHHLS